MSRRLLAALVAVLLAVVAVVLLIAYVQRADERALAGLEPERVIVAVEHVPAGTAAEHLGDLLAVEEVPGSAVVPGGISGLDEVAGLVTATDLQPGEQVLAARFVDPEEQHDPAQVEVPQDMHQLTLQLEPQRVLGGHLAAGDTVGVFLSPEPETHLRLHKVLVTRVQGGAVPVVDDEEGDGAPTGSLMVTLALDAPDAEVVVNAAEFHRVWLSLEPEDVPEDGTRAVDAEELLP